MTDLNETIRDTLRWLQREARRVHRRDDYTLVA